MQPVRPGRVPRVAISAALLLIGLASWGLWRVLSGTEDLPFAQSASPPTSAHVTKDKTYSLAVPGGVRAMVARGVPLANSNSGQTLALHCSWSPGAGETRTLELSPESSDTKAENTIGHFDSPITGALHVDCDGWGAVFIPDADNRPADASGWALVLATITLTIGAGLGLSALRTTWERAQQSPTSDEYDEIEGSVDVAYVGRDDREVGSDDRGDVDG
ncbi:MAG TPA: hypothetical protein VFE19_01850 [Jatrophihabitantaceae bacterium]|nr:hypothetical protein [Jatrophihabitantaceae bacterium]